jgi:hypothetical protein
VNRRLSQSRSSGELFPNARGPPPNGRQDRDLKAVRAAGRPGAVREDGKEAVIKGLIGLAAILIAASSGGCASIVAGGPDWVPVNSTPPGATVKLDGCPVGKTPSMVPLSRSSQGLLSFEMTGFEPATVDVDKILNGWFLGNVLWFPVWPVIPAGMVIDLAAGNAGKFPEKPIHVVLKPAPIASIPVSE